jgi:hypothetical protein
MESPLTLGWLETDGLTALAYQTILHRLLARPGETLRPSPMPPDQVRTEQERVDLTAMIDWFNRTLPYAVIDANARFGNAAQSQERIVVSFGCDNTASLRRFLNATTLGLFDRPPTTGELELFPSAALDAPVTLAQRATIVGRLRREWKSEFRSVGLRKLATVIGGAPAIRAGGDVTPAMAADFKQELYRLFEAHVDEWPYARFFTANEVMVSPETAARYGCTAASGWTTCTMQQPRSGFFTTMGFLLSRPQSFLAEQNNYGRTAAMFFTLYGEGLLAATDGPSADGVPPLPGCLEGTDTRHYQNAPRGTAAVALYGRSCQTCHVNRPLAAGSVLFRPFATNGQVYTPGTLGSTMGPDKDLYDLATNAADPVNPKWTFFDGSGAKLPVGYSYLSGLLAAQPRACVFTGNKTQPYVSVATPAELATELMRNETSFARGFARHAQRAFANVSSLTLETSIKVRSAYEAGRRTIPDLVEAYLMSDTFSCEE